MLAGEDEKKRASLPERRVHEIAFNTYEDCAASLVYALKVDYRH